MYIMTVCQKDSKMTLENYLRYCNDAFDEELQLKAYVTEYADGICTTYYHKDMEKESCHLPSIMDVDWHV